MGRAKGQDHTIKRTTVDVDVTELAAAKKTLGTRTTRDTINGALRQVNRHARLARSAALIAAGDLDVISPDELEALRQVKA
jgi:Arc/MetJ family transcription regulator